MLRILATLIVAVNAFALSFMTALTPEIERSTFTRGGSIATFDGAYRATTLLVMNHYHPVAMWTIVGVAAGAVLAIWSWPILNFLGVKR
jgi:hypothetical protein